MADESQQTGNTPHEYKIPPGFKLLKEIQSEPLRSISWSPDGTLIAAASDYGTIQIFDLDGNLHDEVKSHMDQVFGVVFSPDSQSLAFVGSGASVQIWHPGILPPTSLDGHVLSSWGIDWSPDGSLIASGSDDGTVRLWNTNTFKCIRVLKQIGYEIWGVHFSPDGSILAASSTESAVTLWNTKGQLIAKLTGHTRAVFKIAFSHDGSLLASCSQDRTIRIWDTATYQTRYILDGHVDYVDAVSFSHDDRLLASKSKDNTVWIWRTDTWEPVAVLPERVLDIWRPAVAFHPFRPILATLGHDDLGIRIWELDFEYLLKPTPSAGTRSVHGEIEAETTEHIASTPRPVAYTNARVVLVGDSGVGKSGLALALTNQPWQPTESTHARKIYTFADSTETLPDGHREQRETLLWDLAGQPGYRIIHQLQLVEVAVALLCFDSLSGSDALAGVRYWNKALEQAIKAQGESAIPMIKLLIAARTDRGGIPLSQERINAFVEELGFAAFFETSAKEGWTIAPLQAMIRDSIPWDALPRVSSTATFVSIKDFLTETKERGRFLVTTVEMLYELYLNSAFAPAEERDVRAEFETVIGRVEARGLIRRLSFGKLVLLQPELLDVYAASIVFAARDEPDGLGCISEADARAGCFRMPDDERVNDTDTEKLLLIATVEDLLRHEIAIKDEGDLVFPSQFLRERPDLPDPAGKAVVFAFEGAIQNIYTRLAVRFARSEIFHHDEMWRNAATYTAGAGNCGMWLRELPDGQGELTLFFTPETPESTRFHFEEYAEALLLRHALPDTITRRRMFVCSECGETMNDRHVQARLERGRTTMECPVCDSEIALLDREERLDVVPDSLIYTIDQAADRGRDMAAAEYTIMGKRKMDDFDVFLSHNGRDKEQVLHIAEQLRDHGILPWLDVWELPPGERWQPRLEAEMRKCRTLAYFIGPHGHGDWQQRELQAFQVIDANALIIPVFLPTALPDAEEHLSAFMKTTTWVDFRRSKPDPIEQLIWGITGKRRRP